MRSLGNARKIGASDKRLLREAKELILSHVPGAEVLLYGSVARGTATGESDFDLLVITPAPLTTAEEDRVYDGTYHLALDRDAVLSVVFYSRGDWEAPVVKASPYYRNVAKDCLVV